MGKVQSQRQLRSQPHEKSFKKAPIGDRILGTVAKMLVKIALQVLIFLILYALFIIPYREEWFATAMTIDIFWRVSMPELGGIFILLIISDGIARLICWIIVLIYAWYKSYVLPSKGHKFQYRGYLEYVIYVFLRALCYATGFLWILTALLYPTSGGAAFLLAWLMISLGSKAIAKIIGIKGII